MRQNFSKMMVMMLLMRIMMMMMMIMMIMMMIVAILYQQICLKEGRSLKNQIFIWPLVRQNFRKMMVIVMMMMMMMIMMMIMIMMMMMIMVMIMMIMIILMLMMVIVMIVAILLTACNANLNINKCVSTGEFRGKKRIFILPDGGQNLMKFDKLFDKYATNCPFQKNLQYNQILFLYTHP